MGQQFLKFIYSNNRPVRTYWVLFVPVYVLVMVLISIPLYIAGFDLRHIFTMGSIPLAVAAVFSLGLLKE
jgi:hypothetical protein